MRRSVRRDGWALSVQESGPVDGPLVVLLHGLASDSDTFDRVLLPLGERGLRAVALDLPGHGHSGPSPAGYALSDFSAALLALVDDLDAGPVTLVGHSLGGAIAMTFAQDHPDRVAGLVLVSAGGLGREVHLALRAAAVPFSDRVFGAVMTPALQRVYRHPRVRRRLRLTPDNVANLRRARRALGHADGRRVFFAALRAVIEPGGQRGSFLETEGLSLSEQVPTMVLWSERDPVIPVSHARAVQDRLPGSRVVLFPGGGHEPHRRHVEGVADAIAEFVGSPYPTE